MGSWRCPEPATRHSGVEFPPEGGLCGLCPEGVVTKAGSCAAEACEPRQARKGATVGRTLWVPQAVLAGAAPRDMPPGFYSKEGARPAFYLMDILRQPGRRVKERLRALGLSPRKALGQHFLTDLRILHRIVDAAELTPDAVVIEVGPGLGMLTRALASRAGRVVAIEMDQELSAALQTDLRDCPNVSILTADARKVEIARLPLEGNSYQVVGNLPYYAANPIIRRFLETSGKPSSLVVMVQKEVAQSMVAPPGSMSLLSVAIQFYGKPRLLFTVPPGAFYPPPKVSSAVVRIDVYHQPPVQVSSPEHFFTVVRAGFRAPRKQLRGGLSLALDVVPAEAGHWLEQTGIEPTRRAESLSLAEWAALARAVPI